MEIGTRTEGFPFTGEDNHANPGIVAKVIEEAKGLRIEERWVQIPTGVIKKIGDYDINLKLPGDAECTFKLTVLPEEG